MRQSGYGLVSTIIGLAELFLVLVVPSLLFSGLIPIDGYDEHFFGVYEILSTGSLILIPVVGLTLGLLAIANTGTRKEDAYTGVAINGILLLAGMIMGASYLFRVF
jgi:hypothetical protein